MGGGGGGGGGGSFDKHSHFLVVVDYFWETLIQSHLNRAAEVMQIKALYRACIYREDLDQCPGVSTGSR